MSSYLKTAPAPHRGRPISKTNAASLPKLPAYGKALAGRQRFNNSPFLVVVCVGAGCWSSAKEWNQRLDISALVLNPEQNPNNLQWPVSRCFCIIEWSSGAAETLIVGLVRCLLGSGALSVTVWPLWVDYSLPACYFDTSKQEWTATRSTIRTFYPRQVSHAA